MNPIVLVRISPSAVENPGEVIHSCGQEEFTRIPTKGEFITLLAKPRRTYKVDAVIHTPNHGVEIVVSRFL